MVPNMLVCVKIGVCYLISDSACKFVNQDLTHHDVIISINRNPVVYSVGQKYKSS